MKTVDEIYQIVEESSHETAFNRGEVEGLYRVLHSLPEGSSVLEIGIEFGRSTSVIAEIAKEKWFEFFAVDDWSYPNGGKDHAHVLEQKKKYDWDFTIMSMTSKNAEKMLPNYLFDFVHIDGDHAYEGVMIDCLTWIPKIKKGGYVAFDDYGHPGLDGVKQAVDEYLDGSREFEPYGYFGKKLKVFKKNG